ncbi:MAG: DUF4231 domain-containing protein [Fimbriimonadales bacterium]
MTVAGDVTLDRLEDQISWYDRKSGRAQKWFKGLSIAEVVGASAVPALAGLGVDAAYLGVVGAAVGVCTLLQHLNQFHHNWITYRSTAEDLKHEKYLYLAKAGPYAEADNAVSLLAERIEGLVSQEHAKWVSAAERSTRSREANR